MRGIMDTKHGKSLFVRNIRSKAELAMLVRFCLSPHDFFFAFFIDFSKVDLVKSFGV